MLNGISLGELICLCMAAGIVVVVIAELATDYAERKRK